MITVGDLDDADEDGQAARARFEELQDRAQNAGHELRRTSSGFVLRRGMASRHTPDLDVISQLLKARPRKGS
jgi:hypothetical protein